MRDLSTCTVMVVDDAETNIDILVDTLGADFDITVAMSGEAALESIQKEKPDLILLDIMMPGLGGFEVCRRLKEDDETKDIPIIFVTALTEETDEQKGLALGAIDYITKPFNPPIVKARVRNHLELKVAQEDLRRQNEILKENARLRDDVERITRHDLKSPLNAVYLAPALLRADGNLTPGQLKVLDMLEDSGRRMLQIINNSLNLIKMEHGKFEVTPKAVNLIEHLSKILSENESLIRAKKLTVDAQVDEAPMDPHSPFVVWGEDLLCYSILANLMLNAVEASPTQQKISITLETRENKVITIHNHGAVPEEIRHRFFEKYATSGKDQGTGLGTYSALLMVRSMKGDIEMETSDRNGTTISIYLPSAQMDD